MTVPRRLLLLVALMFWQGGFMFYGAVVVPVGSEVLNSHLEQGFITRSVTNYLNVAGVVVLGVWSWDMAAEGTGFSGRRRLRWFLWSLLALLLCSLAWLHVRLDELLDVEAFRIRDRLHYRNLHRWYLALSTLQWAGSVMMATWTIRAWREADGLRGQASSNKPTG